jgi:hypothetical protein
MRGGQKRDFVVLRMVLGIACVAVVGLIAAPVALANSPAGDQYGSALPGGGSSGNTSGSSPSGGSGTTIPVAPDSSSNSQTATGGSSGSSATKAKANDTRSKGGSSHNRHKADTQKASGNGSGGPGSVNLVNSAGHSVPQIAADSAGDSWLPFFIGGMVALACAAAALVFFRNRRRTAQG